MRSVNRWAREAVAATVEDFREFVRTYGGIYMVLVNLGVIHAKAHVIIIIIELFIYLLICFSYERCGEWWNGFMDQPNYLCVIW